MDCARLSKRVILFSLYFMFFNFKIAYCPCGLESPLSLVFALMITSLFCPRAGWLAVDTDENTPASGARSARYYLFLGKGYAQTSCSILDPRL